MNEKKNSWIQGRVTNEKNFFIFIQKKLLIFLKHFPCICEFSYFILFFRNTYLYESWEKCTKIGNNHFSCVNLGM